MGVAQAGQSTRFGSEGFAGSNPVSHTTKHENPVHVEPGFFVSHPSHTLLRYTDLRRFKVNNFSEYQMWRNVKSSNRQVFDMWKNEHQDKAYRSPIAQRELAQILPYVKELEDRIKELEDEVQGLIEDAAGEDL